MINRNKKIAMSVVRAILLAIFLIAALLPLYWIFVTSIKAGTEIYTFPLKYWPVIEFSLAITSSGVPTATTSPPCTPALGPMSTR